jgi:hypothetical protein
VIEEIGGRRHAAPTPSELEKGQEKKEENKNKFQLRISDKYGSECIIK